MGALARSCHEEADRIQARGNVWVQAANGKWHHCHNKRLVKETIERLRSHT